MPTPLRFALVVVVALVALVPARAQQPTPAQELQKLQAEIKALEEKRRQLQEAEERKRAAQKAAQPKAPEMKLQLVLPEEPKTPAAPRADAHAQLRALAKHPDPKVAALAKELLERLTPPASPAAPKAPKAEKPAEIGLMFEIDGKGGFPLELLFGADGKKGGTSFEIVLEPDHKGGQPIVIRADDAVVAKAEPAKGASSLKMSTDGKTAAVVSADGTVVVYDVASGRELMRFPGKK